MLPVVPVGPSHSIKGTEQHMQTNPFSYFKSGQFHKPIRKKSETFNFISNSNIIFKNPKEQNFNPYPNSNADWFETNTPNLFFLYKYKSNFKCNLTSFAFYIRIQILFWFFIGYPMRQYQVYLKVLVE